MPSVDNVDIYVPDRLREGYGPNLPALLQMKDAGAGVIVTVDCGITAFDPLAGAARRGHRYRRRRSSCRRTTPAGSGCGREPEPYRRR